MRFRYERFDIDVCNRTGRNDALQWSDRYVSDGTSQI